VVALTETWTDYDGNSPYADYTVDGSTLTQTAIYQPGIGRSFDPTDPAATEYYHTDLIGTTRLMTDTPGLGTSPNVVSESSFTAFGEKIGGTTQRYGYAGAWGYQTDNSADGIPFMHVGARYYDPATGRFLQRDSIGVRGGLNVYEYGLSRPTTSIDPEGKWSWGGIWSGIKAVGRAIKAVAPIIGIAVGAAGVVAGAIIGSPALVVVGAVVVVGSIIIGVIEVTSTNRIAKRVTQPIVVPVRRRNRAVDRAIDCTGDLSPSN